MLTKETGEYIEIFLADFKALELPEEQQGEMLELVRERLQDVVVSTLLSMLSDEGRQRFSAAIEKNPVNENEISAITAEVLGLQPALEISLAREYEAIKKAYLSK